MNTKHFPFRSIDLRISLLCLQFLLVVTGANVAADDWYVAPASRVPSNPKLAGTSPDSPWRGFASIRWGAGGVGPGDTLYLIGGKRYRETLTISASGTRDHPIRIACFGSEPCSIQGDGIRRFGLFAEGRSHLHLEGLSITGHLSAGMRILGPATNLRIAASEVQRNGNFGIYLNSQDSVLADIEILGNKVHYHKLAGVFLTANPGGHVSDALIADNLVSHSYLDTPTGLRYGVGIQVYPGFGGPFRNAHASRIEISRNRVHDNHGIGIDLSKRVVDAKITHNRVWDNGSRVPASGIHVGGTEKEHVERIVISDNEVSGQHHVGTDGAGILVDDFSRDVLVTRNTLDNNEEAGIKLHNCRDVQVSSNTLNRNTIGIKIGGATHFELLDNILNENGLGLAIDRKAVQAVVKRNRIVGEKNGILSLAGPNGVVFTDNCRQSIRPQQYRDIPGCE